MKIIPSILFFVGLAATGFAKPVKPLRMGHAHTHGEAQLDIGVDGKDAQLSFHIDTHSLLGFEHPAVSAAEKQAQAKVYATFRKEIARIFTFEPRLKCHFEERTLQIHAEGPGAGSAESHDHKWDASVHPAEDHQSLVGEYDVRCENKINPSQLKFDLSSRFSAVQKIKVHLLTDAGAKSLELPGAGEVVLD